jgi:signal peptidase I
MNWKALFKGIKNGIKRFWKFLWHEDSIWSWLINILIAFILIKFIIYPGIGLLLGTNLPVVAVISESMEHNGNFDTWWNSTATCEYNNNGTIALKYCRQKDWYGAKGITKEEFLNYSMRNGFNKGDIIILRGTSFEDLNVGDVLVYRSKLAYPVIHRVVQKNDVIETKGDHNAAQIFDSRLNEKYITKDQMIGKAWVKVPYLGYVKILFSEGFQCITFNGCKFG